MTYKWEALAGDLTEERDRLLKELAGFRDDAWRYRWLRSEEVCTEPRYYEFWNRFLEAKLVREEAMDKLIDEYRLAQKEEA